MGSRLRRFKARMRGQKLSDGKALCGKNRLTEASIDQLQTYYGLVIRRNLSSGKDMRQAKRLQHVLTREQARTRYGGVAPHSLRNTALWASKLFYDLRGSLVGRQKVLRKFKKCSGTCKALTDFRKRKFLNDIYVLEKAGKVSKTTNAIRAPQIPYTTENIENVSTVGRKNKLQTIAKVSWDILGQMSVDTDYGSQHA
ncbi:hypothetical protein TNCV_3714921 [Trichonephila clavipes]|nr:hypothetical protein TNCV_3714921 [Trichonephila clavipes]